MKVILLTDSIPIRASNTGIPNTGIPPVSQFEKAKVPTTQSVTIYLSGVGVTAAVRESYSVRGTLRHYLVTLQTALYLSAPCCCSLQIWQSSSRCTQLYVSGGNDVDDHDDEVTGDVTELTFRQQLELSMQASVSVLSSHLSTIRCRQTAAGSHQKGDGTVRNNWTSWSLPAASLRLLDDRPSDVRRGGESILSCRNFVL